MIKFLVLISLLTLSACSTPPKNIELAKDQIEARSIVNRFNKEMALRGVKITKEIIIHWKSITAPAGYNAVFATCSKNQMEINKDYWSKHTALQKEVIIYHELAHCHFNAYHRSERNCTKSLMCEKTQFINLQAYAKNKDPFLKDLISYKNNKAEMQHEAFFKLLKEARLKQIKKFDMKLSLDKKNPDDADALAFYKTYYKPTSRIQFRTDKAGSEWISYDETR